MIDPVICARWNSRCVERKCNGGIGNRRVRIQVSRRIFDKFKEGIWWRRRRVNEGSRVEEVGIRRENNRGIHAGV